MKKINLLGLFLPLMVIVFSACGEGEVGENPGSGNQNGGSNNGGGNDPTPSITYSKKLIRVDRENTEEHSKKTQLFYYDNQNRIMKIVTNRDNRDSETLTFSYSDNEININDNGDVETFTLQNGRIAMQKVRSRTVTCEYDATGHLLEIPSYAKFTWKNDDIVNYIDVIEGNKVHQYTVSTIEYKKCPIRFYFYNCDQYLLYMGYYGIVPKYCPTQKYDSESDICKYTYTTDKDGYVTKLETSENDIYSLTWE